RGHSRNPRSLPQRPWANALQLFIHLAREAADFAVIEPLRNHALLSLLQAFHGLLLLIEIAGIFNFRLDGLHLIPRRRRKTESTMLQRGSFRNNGAIPNRSRRGPLSIRN